MPLCSPRAPPATTDGRQLRRRCGHDAQLDVAVVQEQAVAGVDRADQLGDTASTPTPGGPRRLRRRCEARLRRAAGVACRRERPGANLRTAQVLHDCDVAARLAAGLANRGAQGRRAMVRAVGEVQTEYIDAGDEQGFENVRTFRCGADRGDNFGVTHVELLRRSPRIDERLGDPHRFRVGQRVVQLMQRVGALTDGAPWHDWRRIVRGRSAPGGSVRARCPSIRGCRGACG